MYSSALFSAVLLFAASAFSMPADNAGYDPSGGKADSAPDKPYCAKYIPQTGETCASVAEKYKIDVAEFMKWNPTIDKECKHMNAGTAYCITKPNTKGSKPGSKHAKHPKDQKRPVTQDDHQAYVTGSPDDCSRWELAKGDDTCWSITARARISREDFFQWNSKVTGCRDVKPGYSYCVAAPTTYRAIGYAGTDCTGAIHNDISVPPGSDVKNGVCIDIDCQVGGLKIPYVGDCPDGQVQISYYQLEKCSGTGSWYGYGYDSRGKCHHLWKDGQASKSLHLRCAPKENDCATQGTCTVEGEPAVPICKRNSVASFPS
ncbi:hypothetical protein EsDP_00000765 [Epichloe bromicola]|uniref:LysM domain-containing protein n=1 Tax=Epichloe bromicola TaxID=79588 RepID=A0ABQ0CFV1_9HYPO